MSAPFQQHAGMGCFQGQEASFFTESMEGFLFSRCNRLLAILGEQTAIQTLTVRWQLTPCHLPEGVVVKMFQGFQSPPASPDGPQQGPAARKPLSPQDNPS